MTDGIFIVISIMKLMNVAWKDGIGRNHRLNLVLKVGNI